MRSNHWLWIASIFVAAQLCGTPRAVAQVASHFDGEQANPVSLPFTEPIRLIGKTRNDGTQPVAGDRRSTSEAPTSNDTDEGDDAGVVHISDERLVPSPVPPETDSEVIVANEPSSGDDEREEKKSKRRSLWQLSNAPYTVYRGEQDHLTWLPGSGDDFGMVDWTTDSYLTHDEDTGFSAAFNVHWLSGPTTIPLQSRVFDFVWAYQARGDLSPAFSYDVSASVGVYSDFEGSAWEGVRFPGHAVGMFHCTHGVDFVLGIDYLDRDDISLLPVVGLSLRDLAIEGLRLDLVFPRPRIDYTYSDQHRMYVAGELGGGTWDVELPGVAHTVATYRDYRVMFGVESADSDGSLSAWEFGYVFDRTLELRGLGNSGFGDAFMINWVTRR